MVRRVDRQGEDLIWCRKMLRLCPTKNGAQIDELLRDGASGHKKRVR